jgi:hypothetical protein
LQYFQMLTNKDVLAVLYVSKFVLLLVQMY